MKRILVINFIFMLILEIILVSTTKLSFSFLSILGILATSIIVVSILQMVKWRLRLFIHFVFMTLLTIIYVANIVNLSIKQTVLVKTDLLLVGELTGVWDGVADMISIRQLSVLLIPFIYIIIIIKFGERERLNNYERKLKVVYATFTTLIVVAVFSNSTLFLAAHVPNKYVEYFGLQSFYVRELFDFTKFNLSSDDIELSEVMIEEDYEPLEFLAGKKDVVFIVAESLSNQALDPQINPTLTMMAEDGMTFSNYYNINYTTGLNEFSILTGLLSPQSYPSIFNYSEEYVTIPEVFEKNGYCTYGTHANNGDFYDRYVAYPDVYKFQNSYFLKELGIDTSTFYDFVPDSFLFESTNKFVLENDCEKNFIYLMTIYSHIPYGPIEVRNMATEEFKYVESIYPDYDPYLTSYLATTRVFDKMLNDILVTYEEQGNLDDLAIVVIADHFPYGLDSATQKSQDTDYNSEIFESYYDGLNSRYNVPFIIYDPTSKLDDNEEYGSNIDVLPTITEAMGFDDEIISDSLGTSLFMPIEERYVMWYGHNGFSIMSDNIQYEDNIAKTRVGDDELIDWLIDYQTNFLLNYNKMFE